MRVWDAEDCGWLVTDGARWYPEQDAPAVFNVPGYGAKPIGRERLKRTTAPVYQHRSDHVFAAAKGVTWPDIAALYEGLHIYCPGVLVEDQFNATAYGPDTVVLWGKPSQIPRAMTFYVVPHEVGHCVWDAACSGEENPGTLRETYMRLRGYPRALVEVGGRDKDEVVRGWIPDYRWDWKHGGRGDGWAERVNEWLAEDFRFFFGGPHNAVWDLPIPEPGDEVREFWLGPVASAYRRHYRLADAASE